MNVAEEHQGELPERLEGIAKTQKEVTTGLKAALKFFDYIFE